MAIVQEVSQEELRHEILHTWETAKESGFLGILPVIEHPFGLSFLTIDKPVYFLFLGTIITFLILFIGSRVLSHRPAAYQVIVEEIYGFGRNHLGGQMGEEGKKWFPYTLSLFVFLLVLNLIGLIPGSYPVTSNITFTAGLAILTLILVQYQGIRSHGLGGYVGQWVPHGLPDNALGKVVLTPFLFVIEAFSRLISQPLTLALRLYANILAGHLVIFVFLSLILYFGPISIAAPISFVAALVFYAFEVFIAVLQAYIFAILTQLYIELAMFGEGGETSHADVDAGGAQLPAP
jgi:F-type H+-transporting ATPase subunit a